MKNSHSYWYCLLLLFVLLCSITNTAFSKTQDNSEKLAPIASTTTAFLSTNWITAIFESLTGSENKTQQETNTTELSSLTTQINDLKTLQERYAIAVDCEVELKLQQEIATTRQSILKHIKQEAGYDSFDNSMALEGGCPEIQVIELLGIPGFIETEELVICGAADTLAYLVFIEEPGNISGTQMTANFLPGMQYAGFELTHYGGPTTIANLDPSLNQPKFLLEGITEGVYVAYIGVESNCEADLNAFDYTVDLDFTFIYEDTLGNFQQCRQTVTPERSYNAIIKEPVLNFRGAPNAIILTLGEEYCTNITISQDGISAYLEEMEFSICNADFANDVSITSLSANGTPIPYTYNPADSTLTATVGGSFFLNNASPNPADALFNESEVMTMTLCVQSNACPINNTQSITYKAAYYCNGDVCQVATIDSEIRVQPSARPLPIVSSELKQIPGVCGDPAIVELTLQSSIADSATGIFTDVIFGFETCQQSALDISQVTIGGGAIASTNYEWIGTDLKIDLTGLTTDPDGAGGITDADGDGFFDDLPGGQMVTVQVELEYLCALPDDPSALTCTSLNCTFADLYVEAKRDCGQAFSYFPEVEEFCIANGATSFGFNNLDTINTSTVAYNFGTTRTTGANCSPLPVRTKTVEFCYVYERKNIAACDEASTTNELQVVFDGSPMLVNDIEFVAGSGQMTVNGVVTQTGVTGTITDLSVTSRVLNLPIGELNIGDEVCYIYELAADTASCTPPIYMNGSHQVIETCATGDCTCQTVKACDVVLFRSDPSNCSCICDINSGATVRRWNLGYTDETMTEKVKLADVPLEDQNRYLPCDTMYYQGWMTFNTPQSVAEVYQWYFLANITSISTNGWGGNDNTELMIDAAGTELLGLDFAAQGGAGKIPIDLSALADCMDNPATTGSTGFFSYGGKTPWPDARNFPMCNSGYEFHDGNLFGIYFYNFNELEDCRGVETAAWEESNCLTQLKEAYNIGVGDTIYMNWLLPLTKNVKAAANKIADPSFTFQDPQILNVAAGLYIDEFDSDCLVGLSNCRENTPFQTYCPSEITAATTVSIDDCGGEVEHTFNVVNTTPVNWYANEYRPFFQVEDIEVPMYSPLIYCGNAKLVRKNGEEYPLTVQSTTNHDCATVNGQEYCTVSGASTGTVTFNPDLDNIPDLGVGLGGYLDEFTIVYDLCKICPAALPDMSDYEIAYNYRTCEPLNGACFRCNQSAIGTSNELPLVCGLDGSTPVDRLEYYYDKLGLDSLFVHERTSMNNSIQDISNGFPPLTQTQDRNLVSSGSPGISEEINTIEVCADGSDPNSETHVGMLSSITLTNSVAFVNAYDANMNPLVFDTVSTSATTTTYAVYLPDLAPGECTTFKIGTQLLFCPEDPDRPRICVTTTSGCMDREIMAALAGETSACNSIETCYEYIFEEAGIQADFLLPEAGTQYQLCDSISVAVLVKNVKLTTVADLILDINMPLVGAQIIPGSFEASYPNSGDLTLPFYSIVDPTINGNNLIYLEDNDFSNAIHSNGFPGIASGADSNFVVVRFLLETTCDEFVSGSQATFQASAADPCSPDRINSGTVNSDRFIIQGADPEDFGQILITAKPSEAYCGQDSPTFIVTGQNISEKPLGDSVITCITLPAGLTYQPNSMRYAIPSNLNVGTEIVTMINGQTQICFQGYENMPVGGAFTLNFEADFDIDQTCGDYEVMVDIKDLVEDQACSDGGFCDVFVQTSVNPFFTLTLKGPLETVDLQLFRRCTDTEDPVEICYEVTLTNPGADYTGDINVNLHDDVLADNILDFYDPILGNTAFSNVFLASGDSITLSGCFTVDEINSCPVIIDLVYDTPCACDHNATPYKSIEPEFMAMLPPTTVLCPGEELGLEVCGNYDLSYSPAGNIVERAVGDSIYLSIVDPSVLTQIVYTGMAGECSVSAIRFIRGLVPFEFGLTTSTCEGQNALLQVEIPSEYKGLANVQWAPTAFLDDPNRLDPIFNSSTPGTYSYEVTLTIGNCILKDSVFVEVKPIGTISITGNETICAPYETNTLTADAGFDYYEWYLLDGGFEIVKASTPTEVWAGPTEPGKYIVKGFRSTDMCPSISESIMIMQANCIDLELEKSICEIAAIPHLGDTISYQITVCNRRVVDSLLIHDANMVMVTESLPAGVQYVSNSTTQGTYTGGLWNIGTLPSGACETLKIAVKIIATGKQKNTAEISNSDKEDIDSEEDNDDGDQSEDDEDMAMFTVPACMVTNNGPVCEGDAVNLSEIGGDAATWDWSGPASFSSTLQNPTVAPALAGVYTVLVTDVNGNVTTCATEVVVHPALQVQGTIVPVSCNGDADGTITIEVLGGTSPFTYDWNDDGAETPDNDTKDLTAVVAGNYSLTVTDAVGCFVIADFVITEPPVLACTIATQTNILCNGEHTGDIQIAGTGGVTPYEYSLNTGPWQSGNLFTSLPAGIYITTIRDANGCTSTCETEITEPSLLTCSLAKTDVTDCNITDGTITVTGAGGMGIYEYSLDGAAYQSSNSFTGLMSGGHIVMIRDENNCISECEITLTAPEVPMCTIDTFESIKCMGDATGSFTVTGTGGTGVYEYSLDNVEYQPNATFTGLTAGMYTVYIRNTTSPMCVSMCAVSLTEPTQLVCNLTGTPISCMGGTDGTITVNAIGGVLPYEYSLDGGAWQSSPAYSNLTIGTYVVRVRDANECISECSITLTEPPLLLCSLSKVEPLCNGGVGSVTVTGTGGVTPYEYSINSGAWQASNLFADLPAGSYTTTIRDANNCTSICEITIQEPPLLTCTTVATDVTDCGITDGTITVTGTGGTGAYVYSLNGGTDQASPIFTGLAAGTYTIFIKDENDCISECSAVLIAPEVPICTIGSIENIACMGEANGSFIVNATGGSGVYEYSLDNINYQISNAFTGLTLGTYTVYTRNIPSRMCVTTCMVTLTEPEVLTCSLTGENIACFEGTDGTITVAAVGGTMPYEYSLDGITWQSSPDFAGLTAASYTITVRDANACRTTCNITLTEPSDLTCSLETEEPLCNGGFGSIQITGAGGVLPYEYSLDGVTWQINTLFNDLVAGPYTLTVRDAHGCLNTCTSEIQEPPVLMCEIGEVIPEDCVEDSGLIEVLATGGTIPLSYSIDGGITFQASNIFSGLTDGFYEILIQDANGCQTICEADVLPTCFDLALNKTTTAEGPFNYGDVVTFDFTVYNQGNITATNIEVTEYTPCGYEFVPSLNPQWTAGVGNTAKTLITDVLEEGDFAIVSVSFIVQSCAMPGAWKNVGEISASEDDNGNDTTNDDIDSNANDDPNDDGDMEDDATDNENGDEDDSDFELIEIFDLAQIKQIVTPAPYVFGDTLCFNMTVVNQGNIPATNIEITDNLPAAYEFDASLNPNWDATTAPAYTYLITDTLAMNDTAVISMKVILVMTEGSSAAFTNISEISMAQDTTGMDGDDADSMPDDDPDNDGDADNDSYDDEEDDHDPETIRVFDLALNKTTSAIGPFAYGDTITFDFKVINQGNITATNIEITEQTPCGYAFVPALNPAWTAGVGNTATTIITDILQGGDSTIVSVSFIIQPCAMPGAWRNTGEISASEDGNGNDTTDDDIDSNANDDPNDDGDMEDDATGNENGDEDDSDFEVIEIFDLAQKKSLVSTGPYVYGDTLSYAITVYNQGNVPATNIEITDYLPSGLVFYASSNPSWTGTAPIVQTLITDTLFNTGDSIIVYLDLVLTATNEGSDGYKNISEISAATDESGNPRDDIDSEPDDDPTNDGDMEDDATDNENGDEDDSDFEVVEIFDLALKKQLAPTQVSPIVIGSPVTYWMTVYNQGNIAAYDIAISDYIPTGLLFDATLNTAAATGNANNWSLVSGNPTYVVDALAPLDSITVAIIFTIDITFGGGPIINYGEIGHAAGIANGPNRPDVDSRADRDTGNDAGGNSGGSTDNEVNDDGTADEDDHDPAEIFVIANQARIIDPCTCIGGGLLRDKITIYSPLAGEIWTLTQQTGMYRNTSTVNNLVSVPLGTQATYVGIENGLYKFELEIIHVENVGYTSEFNNGLVSLNVNNTCSCPASFNDDPDSTPGENPDIPLVFNSSKTPAENTLKHCEGTTFTSSIAEHTLYNDDEPCRIAHTICPQTQWQKITYTLDKFDLAEGDTLCVFQDTDTTGVPIAKWSGVGVSQTGGWISSACSPANKEQGCLTFLFKTNGDRNKGTGFSGRLTCEDRGIEISAAIKNGKVGCDNPLDWIEFPAPTITAACDPNGLGDPVVSLVVKNQAGELCMEPITQLLSAYPDTLDLAIGIYTAEYFLTADSVKTTGAMVFNVAAPSLVCNDEVNVSLNSGCGLELSPDDLLENPCTPTSWLSYEIRVVLGTGKDTVQVQGSSALLTGSGSGSASTPIVWISKEAFQRAGIDGCSGSAEVTIEKVYYADGVPNGPDCDNGIQREACTTIVNFSDNTKPIIQLESIADTLVSCDTIGLASLLEAIAIDNCDEEVDLTYSITLSESDPCLSDAGSPDTTLITVNYTATDACGNVGKAEKRIVMLRPTTFVVPATTIASCSEEDIEVELPGVEIGYKTATEFVITDTLALDTTDYVCGYLLTKEAQDIPANECGRKQYLNWSVLDWCNSGAGGQFIGTQLINYQDTLAPAFAADSLVTITIAFAEHDCSYDVTSIVAPVASDNCSEPIVSIDSIFRIEEGSLWGVAQSDWTSLDADSFSIRWVASDVCHEQLVNDTLNQIIVLEDNTAPYAICTDGLNVTLGMDSTRVHYSDIDGGSTDACGIVTHEVSTDQENWSEHVSVNCADLHEGLKVHLRVTDAAGNEATCWMEITPEDKLAPICTDLATVNTTCSEGHAGQYGVSTDTDEDGEMEDSEWVNLTGDLEVYYNETFGHPSCSDNLTCQEITIEQQYQLISSTCGRIEVARRYRARDWEGEGMTSGWATQFINVVYEADWSLTLPVDWVGDCGEEIPTANLAITNGTCDAIAFEIDEQVFTAAEDACMKVIRTYRIINWCKYQADQAAVQIVRQESEGSVRNEQQITAQDTINGVALAEVGLLEYIQVLKVQDNEAPSVITNPISTCLEDCTETRYFSATAIDCNLASTDLIRFSWELFENGIAQSNGVGDGFEWEVGANNYQVIWTARDACGNITKVEETYNFEDCKQPTAYCLNGVAIELMPTGMVEIWASDLNVNSFDQCPDNEIQMVLWHSSLGIAAPATTETVAALPMSLELTCEDIGSQEVYLYIIDAAGNYDYCKTYIIVQDNNNTCPSSINESQAALVSGQVMSWKGDAVEQVMLSTNNTNYETQSDGVYHLQLPMYIDYTITPEKDMNPLNGVSTFDLVLMTKHILAVQPFTSPYQWIAADVNRSGTVTAFDMVQLRRLILAIDDNFKQNTSWRFVENDYVFENENPLGESFPEVAQIINLSGDMAMDFTAVKIGDVNGNARPNSLYEAEVRTSSEVLELQVANQYLKAGTTYEVVFTTEQLAQIQGYQFTLNFADLRVDKVQGNLMQLENFGLQGMDKGWITASWNSTADGRRSMVDGVSTPLFTLHFLALADGNLSDLLHLGARPTAVEAYNQVGEIMEVELAFTEAIVNSEFDLFQNEPNPFSVQTSIGYTLPADSEIELILRDEAGRVLRVIKEVGKAGRNQIQLNELDLPAGFIYYQLNTKYGTKSKKMLRIE